MTGGLAVVSGKLHRSDVAAADSMHYRLSGQNGSKIYGQLGEHA